MLSLAVDAERPAVRAPAHDLDQPFVVVARGHAVVEGDARWQPGGDLAGVDHRPALLSVIVRRRAPVQEAEAVAQTAELGGERIGRAALEPADAARRPAGEDGAGVVCGADRAIDAVQPPDREHRRGLAPTDG